MAQTTRRKKVTSWKNYRLRKQQFKQAKPPKP
ncbi:hypothetical protein PPTG_21241 [Phytophthora nicotianae INRA-310]|uniref:Uncharacterized protein n=1 Tax=Phytophthora nicotianae (strain INRA-310) TaxID=761204 RepID=W2R6N1_PHYN3|nr:hypothetical protein PPTG_21241 [Phytophthora nicotianae INRA-310]ETN20180.1 hypothetical protein PPTG_21241 [Phytophthora nicotianae INRA-310]